MPKLEDKPPAWCRSLARSGEGQKLLTLQGSVRGGLGTVVERQLRALKILSDFDLTPDETRPPYLQQRCWRDETEINPGVMALLDLISFDRDKDTILDPTKQTEVTKFLTKQSIEATEYIAAQLHETKKRLIPLHENLLKLINAAEKGGPAWLSSAEVINIVGHYNDASNTKELENGMAGGNLKTKIIICLRYSPFFGVESL